MRRDGLAGSRPSDRSSTGYDFETIVEDLAALIDHLDLRDVTLVGHSMGGAAAAELIARHGSARIARVAFISSMIPFLKQTDDNPVGVPEAAFDALYAAMRADRTKWLSDQSQVFFATHLGRAVSPYRVHQQHRPGTSRMTSARAPARPQPG